MGCAVESQNFHPHPHYRAPCMKFEVSEDFPGSLREFAGECSPGILHSSSLLYVYIYIYMYLYLYIHNIYIYIYI